MCSGIALPLSEIPAALIEQHKLAERVHVRGGEAECRFLYWVSPRLLPVRHQGRLTLASWGLPRGAKSALPLTGWTWQATVESGFWAQAGAEPVVIPATFSVERGIWFAIRKESGAC